MLVVISTLNQSLLLGACYTFLSELEWLGLTPENSRSGI